MSKYINRNLLVIIGAIFSAALFLYLSSIYLPLSYQLIVGWGLLIPLLVFRRRDYLLNKIPFRIFFLLIAAFISLRYWSWRTTDTLFYLGFFDFIAVMLLYWAETYSIIVHLLGMFVNIQPLKRSPVPLPDNTDTLPTVDIFLPTYTEPEDIVHLTTVACTQIDYPKDKINIYILDDGGTLAKRNNPKTSESAWERYRNLKKLAQELGVHYISREKNEHAKAGNVNNALKYSSGDLILMLDCDHVPAGDILQKTVGLFLRDKKLFLVQTPHFFINPSPVEKNLGTFDAPTENEMFYSSIQLGLDFWNSSFFCGSAAILRRKYVEEVGGIVGETITEDAETALALHSKGYNSAYISHPMVCGLSPETFDDFILQRSRWSQGMTQIFILKNPIFLKGLSIYQRICYTNSCIFWFFGLSRIVFYLAPLAFLFFNLRIYNASAEQILVYTAPHVVATIVVTDFLYGMVRWSFFSELYESIQSIFILPAVISAVINPRSPTFKVTPKGQKLDKNYLSSLAGPFYIFLVLILIGFPIAAIKWIDYPAYRYVIGVCTLWSLYNLFLILACLGVVRERRDTRKHHRMSIQGEAKVFFPRFNLSLEGKIKDLSLGGAGIEFTDPLPDANIDRNEEVFIEPASSTGDKYRFKAQIMRKWENSDNKTEVGLRYQQLEDKETYANLVKFFYGDSMRWNTLVDQKLKSIGIRQGFLYLIKKGIEGAYYNFKDLKELYLEPKLRNLFGERIKRLKFSLEKGK